MHSLRGRVLDVQTSLEFRESARFPVQQAAGRGSERWIRPTSEYVQLHVKLTTMSVATIAYGTHHAVRPCPRSILLAQQR